jgi:hypothetical protein
LCCCRSALRWHRPRSRTPPPRRKAGNQFKRCWALVALSRLVAHVVSWKRDDVRGKRPDVEVPRYDVLCRVGTAQPAEVANIVVSLASHGGHHYHRRQPANPPGCALSADFCACGAVSLVGSRSFSEVHERLDHFKVGRRTHGRTPQGDTRHGTLTRGRLDRTDAVRWTDTKWPPGGCAPSAGRSSPCHLRARNDAKAELEGFPKIVLRDGQ